MVKGIINAFDHMKLCFIVNLTKDGNWAITRPAIFATGNVSLATTFLYQVASTCYQQKKLISNTVLVRKFHKHVLFFRWGWLGFNCGSTFGISGVKWKLAARYSDIAMIQSGVIFAQIRK